MLRMASLLGLAWATLLFLVGTHLLLPVYVGRALARCVSYACLVVVVVVFGVVFGVVLVVVFGVCLVVLSCHCLVVLSCRCLGVVLALSWKG